MEAPDATGAWSMHQPPRQGVLLRKEFQEQATPKVRIAGLIHSEPRLPPDDIFFHNYRLNNQNQDILNH